MSDPLDPVALNITGVSQLVNSKINKINSGIPEEEGAVGERIDEFALDMSEEELIKLSRLWEAKYMGYEAKIKARQNANRQYYIGKQNAGTSQVDGGMPIAANLLFEAVETFIPAALAKNPEPVVWADNTPEGNAISGDVKTMLQFHTDVLCLRNKLSMMVRHWTIYFMGVLKHGWDDEIQEIKTEKVQPQCLVLDPDAEVDCYGDYEGKYIGEKKNCTAQELADLFPKHKDYISLTVEGMMGTEVLYTEWWTNEYCFYTFKQIVLDKAKNPHFNYSKKVPGIDAEGQPVETEQPGSNHFARPKKPYTFLTVFSLGDQPHDITGLIEQNIPNQNRISKREVQIDVNLDHANNSVAFSEENFTQETGKQAAMARQKGNPILVPPGRPISEAIHMLPSQSIPDSFFKAADRDKQDLRSIFGVDGLGTTPPDKQKTLGGLLNNEQHDDTRIGGGVGDRLEQVAKNVFNWWVQLYYVYYDVQHFAAIMGQMKATEYVILKNSDLNRKLIVSVTPDSMKPHDELTEMNQAMTLWEQKALDIKTLLTRLNFPDPQNTAAQVWLYQTNPQLYGQLNFPELTKEIQSLVQPQVAQQPNPQQL